MDIIIKNVSELHVAEKNVRKHPQTQLAELKKSYDMFGQYRPLVVSHDGEILVGNGFFTMARENGIETVSCIVLPENTPQKYKNKLMLADNKVFELGANNYENIDDLFKSMDDFDVPGFDEATLSELYSVSKDAMESIGNMFTIPDNVADNIRDVAEKREQGTDKPMGVDMRNVDKYTPVSTPTQNVGDENKSYITCPHCGTKIWL